LVLARLAAAGSEGVAVADADDKTDEGSCEHAEFWDEFRLQNDAISPRFLQRRADCHRLPRLVFGNWEIHTGFTQPSHKARGYWVGRGFNSRQLHHLTVQRRSLKSSERLFSL